MTDGHSPKSKPTSSSRRSKSQPQQQMATMNNMKCTTPAYPFVFLGKLFVVLQTTERIHEHIQRLMGELDDEQPIHNHNNNNQNNHNHRLTCGSGGSTVETKLEVIARILPTMHQLYREKLETSHQLKDLLFVYRDNEEEEHPSMMMDGGGGGGTTMYQCFWNRQNRHAEEWDTIATRYSQLSIFMMTIVANAQETIVSQHSIAQIMPES
jgi:hypothetical protein